MKQVLLALAFLSLNALNANPWDDTPPTENILQGIHTVSTHLAYDRFSEARAESAKLQPIVEEWLLKATESHTQFPQIKKVGAGMAELAESLEETAARKAFSVASEGIVNFLRADKVLQKNWQLHFCPHVEGHYAFWVQPLNEPRMNPYFGSAMFSCGMKKPW